MQSTEREKISANQISDKGLLFKMHNEYITPTAKTKQSDFKRKQRNQKDTFPKKTYK